MGIIGAILGDAAGMPFEFGNAMGIDEWQKKPYDLYFGEHTYGAHITDDSILSIAAAKAISNGSFNFEKQYVSFARKYPNAGYGHRFAVWAFDTPRRPLSSFGNGAAMRVSYCGSVAGCLEEAQILAYHSARPSHDHIEGIKGAVITASCVWMAENGYSKEAILKYGQENYPKSEYYMSPEYDLAELSEVATKFDVTCQGSVPLAIRLFYEFDRFDEMMFWINARHIDCDTVGAIAGSIFQSYYGECTKDDDGLIRHLLKDSEWLKICEEEENVRHGTLLSEFRKLKKKPPFVKMFCKLHPIPEEIRLLVFDKKQHFLEKDEK